MNGSPGSIPSQLPAWKALEGHARTIQDRTLQSLFETDAGRFDYFSLRHDAILLDYSRNRITSETLPLLCQLAESCQLKPRIEDLFNGALVNYTEGRAALHTALRQQGDSPVWVAGEDIIPGIRTMQRQMRELGVAIRSGAYRGSSGARITDVVHIGIGGSHLGPQMVCTALQSGPPPLRLHFVSNIDGHAITSVLAGLDARSTLFIVASKSFTTQETHCNALSAKCWLQKHLSDSDAYTRHFIGITANTPAAREFGIQADMILEFRDWVGGRFSLWSAIGLPIVLALGMEGFEQLLAGAASMDRHFREAPFVANMPVLLALLGIWYNNFLGHDTHAIVPYDCRLQYLPAYLQQLEMESNGKGTDRDGEPLRIDSAPIIWGGIGTDSQHAFFQLLHQGTRKVTVDFLLALNPGHSLDQHHRLLVANCLAQAEALMQGRGRDVLLAEGVDKPLASHRSFSGNRPSNTLLFDRLDPYTLGGLIALYEHKVFVQGVIWNINSFDQWGVELGKQLTSRILGELDEPVLASSQDATTRALLACYHRGSVCGDDD